MRREESTGVGEGMPAREGGHGCAAGWEKPHLHLRCAAFCSSCHSLAPQPFQNTCQRVLFISAEALDGEGVHPLSPIHCNTGLSPPPPPGANGVGEVALFCAALEVARVRKPALLPASATSGPSGGCCHLPLGMLSHETGSEGERLRPAQVQFLPCSCPELDCALST